jgi:phosphate transport system substrate-binding protein
VKTYCAAIVLLCACIPASAQLLINGAGATFPYPIYAKWFDEYRKINPKAQINYQSIGSGGGIRQLQAGTVDFGASDSPMTDEQIASAGGKVLHFPTVLGAVVPTYNIPGVNRELNFTAEALAGIFLGVITRWNDAELARANPGVPLPAAGIVVVHRSDGSGTTFVWTDYLSKANPAWKQKVGAGTAVKWPAGLGAKGNEGISGLVRQTPHAIGYVELVYALQNKMSYGRVRNAAGVFVKANLASVTAAGASAALPDDFRVSITNPPGKDAYPIASFTWLLVPARIEDPQKRGVITAFLRWMLADGQRMAEPLGYSPLPKALVSRELKAVGQIK